MKKQIWGDIGMAICIFFLGLALVVWADRVINVVSIMLGILAMVYAIFGFIKYFKNDNKQVKDNLVLIYAIALLVMGGILIFRVNFLKELVSFIIGIYILISSVIKLSESMTLQKNLNTKLPGAILLAALGVVIGILAITGKFLFPDIIITYIGVMLIIYSIISIINVILINGKKVS